MSVSKSGKKHREEEIILGTGSVQGRGLLHMSFLSLYPLAGEEVGLKALLKTCAKVDKHNSSPVVSVPTVTFVNSATRKSFNVACSHGKRIKNRYHCYAYMGKFGGERDHLIIVKFPSVFSHEGKSMHCMFFHGTAEAADVVLQSHGAHEPSEVKQDGMKFLITVAVEKLLGCP